MPEEKEEENLNPEEKKDTIVETPIEKKEEESERDEEVDIAKATEIARNFIKDNIGSLIAHQFNIESIDKNGAQTRYIVLCSVVPDVGEEKDYYLIKVNVQNGKIVLPVGKGKKNVEGKLELEEIKVDPKWKE